MNAVFPDSTLLFYQGSEDGVKTGDVYKILRDEFVIGEAVATKVEKQYSFARITIFTMPVRRGDRLRKERPEMFFSEPAPLQSMMVFGERETMAAKPRETGAEKAEKPAAPAATEQGVVIEEKTKKRLEKAENPLKFEFNGFHYLKYRAYGASGANRTFISDSGLLLRGQSIEQGSNLDIKATYKDSFTLGGHVFQMPLQEREMIFDFESGNIAATMGDFSTEFITGELSPLNKKVSGGGVSYSTKKLDVTGLFSESKSFRETQSFSGNGTYGPYRINAFEILQGSETVQVNGETLAEDMYQLDYFAGKITFCSGDMPPDCRVISESDRVQVTYEQKLLLSLRGEGVTGLGAAYRPGTKYLSEVGFSYLTEDASGSDQRILVDGLYLITPAELNAQTAATDRMPADATPTLTVVLPIPDNSPIKESGYLFLKPNFETVKDGGTPLISGEDFEIRSPDDYARGIIRLFSPPAATITVQYIYYSHVPIRLKPDEEISEIADLEGSAFQLEKFTVYAGTEIVKECARETGACDVNSVNCDPISSGYTINEDSNEIIFTGNVASILSSKRICVAYYHVPSEPPRASQFDHTILDVTTSWDFGELLGFKYEFARSEADVSRTPIQIVRERVTTFGSAITCPSAALPELCEYELRNDNIIEGTERIAVSSSDLPFLSGREYFLEIDTGRLRFASATFATGTVVYADYQYSPPADAGVRTGGAYSLSATGAYRILEYTYKKQRTDTVFSPLGGNTTLETDRSEISLALKPYEGLGVSYQKKNFTRAQDVDKINSTKTGSSRYSLDYKKGWLTALSYSVSKEDGEDDRDPHLIAYSRDARNFLFGVEAPFVKGLTINFEDGAVNYADASSESNSNDSKTTTYGFSYAPNGGEKYSVDAKFSRNSSNYFGLTTYSTTNRSRYIGFDITPIELISVSAEINSQRVGDSRPGSFASGLDKSVVSISAQPFWRVSALNATLNKEDYPGRNSGATRVKSSNYAITFDVFSGFKVTPAYSTSGSQVTGSGASSNNTRSVNFEYNPSGRPYAVRYMIQNGTESSATAGSTTSRSNLEMIYKFSEKLDAGAKLDKSDRSSNYGTGNSDQTFALSLNYLPKDDWTLTTKWERNRADSTRTQVNRRNLYLTSEMKISKILSWNLDYQIRKYTSPSDPKTNFNGNILETEIKAEF